MVVRLLVVDGVKYKLWTPKDEEKEFHPMIKEHSKEIFGEDSIYFDVKHKLKSRSGIGSIPDAYVISLSKPYEWYIVENELSAHRVYEHIVPQISKFISGIENLRSQREIRDVLYKEITRDKVLKAHVEKTIQPEEIHHFLSALVSKPPTIAIIIDEETDDVREASKALKKLGETEIVEFQTYVREGAETVHAHLFEPICEEDERKTPSKEVTIKQHLDKIKNEKMRQMATELREATKSISEVIEEKTSRYYIIFRTTVNFAAIYTQKRGFWLAVKIPRNEFNIKGLDVGKHKDPVWTHIRVNEDTDLSLLVEAAKEAYERTL